MLQRQLQTARDGGEDSTGARGQGKGGTGENRTSSQEEGSGRHERR